MSGHYNGKLTKVEQPEGKLKKQKLIAEITQFFQFGETKRPYQVNKLKGSFEKQIVATGKKIIRLDTKYVWFESFRKFFNKHSATADSAPAKEITVDNYGRGKTEFPLYTLPASTMAKRQEVKVGFSAVLHGYIRAGCTFIKNLVVSSAVNLFSAFGAVAKFHKGINITRTSKAVRGAGAIAKSSHNEILSGIDATGTFGTAKEASSENSFITTSEATAGKGTGTDVVFQGLQNTGCTAKMIAWFMPEQDGNRVKIFQPYSAIQTGNRVAIDMESESAYWANPHQEGNRLKLVFAETATQTDNRLEVR